MGFCPWNNCPPISCPRGRYHLAVTRHHENEGRSSSIYTQHDPWDPLVNFETFIRDDESIENQVRGCGLGIGGRAWAPGAGLGQEDLRGELRVRGWARAGGTTAVAWGREGGA